MNRKSLIIERNKAIVQDYLDKLSLADISEKNKISITRVSQVIEQFKQNFILFNKKAGNLVSHNMLKRSLISMPLVVEFKKFMDNQDGIESAQVNVKLVDLLNNNEVFYNQPIDLPVGSAYLLPDTIKALQCNGFTNMGQIAEMTPVKLLSFPFIGKKKCVELLNFFKSFDPHQI